MSGPSGISGSTSAGSAPPLTGISFGQNLTPEMILFMCQRQLQQMDIQIGNAIALMEQNRVRADDIGRQILEYRELLNSLRGCGAFEDGKLKLDKLNDPECAALRQQLGLDDEDALLALLPDEATMESLGYTSGQITAVNNARTAIRNASDLSTTTEEPFNDDAMRVVFTLYMRNEHGIEIGSGNDIDLTILEDKIQALTEEQRLVNSESEMMMVQLQSRMQQRTQIIQLGSNMLKSIDEALDTVVGNMR
jgi:hypothetical protein